MLIKLPPSQKRIQQCPKSKKSIQIIAKTNKVSKAKDNTKKTRKVLSLELKLRKICIEVGGDVLVPFEKVRSNRHSQNEQICHE